MVGENHRMKKLNLMVPGLLALLASGCAFMGSDNGESVTTYLNSAKSNLANQQYNTALESANQAIELDSQNYEAYYLAAQINQQLKNTDAAALNYQKSFNLNGKYESMLISYADFLCSMQNYPQAQNMYANAMKNAANQSVQTSVSIANGSCQTSQNKLDDAISSYTDALRDESAPLAAYVGISYAYVLENNYATAYYYINLYNGAENIQSLQMRIVALKGLLASNDKLTDRRKLQATLDRDQKRLAELQIAAATPLVVDNQPQTTNNAIVVTSELTPTQATKKNKIIVAKAGNNVTTTLQSTTLDVVGKYPALQTMTENGRRYVVVRKNDTLYNIALRSKVSQAKLIKLNSLNKGNVVTGTKLYLD